MRLAALPLLLLALTGAGPVCDAVWRDAARGRDLPVRIRMPDGSGRVPVVLFSPGLGGNRQGGAPGAGAQNGHPHGRQTAQLAPLPA